MQVVCLIDVSAIYKENAMPGLLLSLIIVAVALSV